MFQDRRIVDWPGDEASTRGVNQDWAPSYSGKNCTGGAGAGVESCPRRRGLTRGRRLGQLPGVAEPGSSLSVVRIRRVSP